MTLVYSRWVSSKANWGLDNHNLKHEKVTSAIKLAGKVAIKVTHNIIADLQSMVRRL